MSVHDLFARALEMLIGRTDGPFTLRLIMQPTVAAIFAVRAGLRDAREGRAPYLFRYVLGGSADRPELLRQLWKDVGKVFIMATALDMIYELIVYRWVYPLQALIVAAVLAIIPYLVIRGPVTRIVRHFCRR